MVGVNLQIDDLSGRRTPTSETAHRIILKSQEKGRLLPAFLLLGGLDRAS